MDLAVINPLTLPSLPLGSRSALPSCAAIYFALEGDRILYIGRAGNLQQRWLAHHRYSQLSSEARIAWLESSDTELLPEIETALIAHFNPPLNGSAVTGDKPKVVVYIEPELKKATEELAKKQRRSVSSLVCILLERAIKEARESGELD